MVTYPVNELIKCLPDKKSFGCTSKYWVHPELVEDLNWSFNLVSTEF